jgi:hypothetical protein
MVPVPQPYRCASTPPRICLRSDADVAAGLAPFIRGFQPPRRLRFFGYTFSRCSVLQHVAFRAGFAADSRVWRLPP